MERTTLVQYIRHQEKKFQGATGEFTSLMNEILIAAKIVSCQVNKAGIGEDILGLTGRTNVQGEEVQKLDEYANSTFIKLVGQSGTVCAITSEECKEPLKIPCNHGSGKYIFKMDPLDGSSNIDVNVSIGTIFSIFRKKTQGADVTDEDLFQRGDQQVAAGYAIYGSSTMFVYADNQGVRGFTLDPELGEFFLSHPGIRIPAQGSTYSVNEGHYSKWEERQKRIVNHFKEEDDKTGRPYGLRYIGSLVSDVHRTLLKGGIFMYPADKKNPNGKLRLAFEAVPLAFIVESAGGRASDGTRRILDITPTEVHQRVPLYIGSKDDVETAERIFAES
ncbi:MAG: class 1 fructose-bisphosphatase [Nitrospinae bacterium]|nr:class 1 fructose-bisphosphatase [Nitrospinota bacterium]